MNLLPFTIYLSFAGAAACLLLGPGSVAAVRRTALVFATVTWGITLAAGFSFDPAPIGLPASGPETLVDVPWVESMGIRYHLAADGISLTLVVLTGLAATAGVLFSWNVKERANEFFALYLTLIGGVYGVFLSADAFLFFVFYEIAIVPKYFLIANWGSTNREYGAMKLAIYSFASSALVLAGLLWAYASSGGQGFGLAELAESATRFSSGEQIGMFSLVFFGFAVLAGLVPFHTWAPTGHVAAPTAASMLLAGVVMKLGAYGCLRVAMPLFPAGLEFWQPTIAWLAVGGIVYAGLVALVQDDFKFVIGYSSVSHMGFVMLGLAAANRTSISGAVLQMFSHGVIAGLLFAVAGRLVYDRTHTRQLSALQRLPLHRLMPFTTGVFILAGLASMGLPGFSGFPAEFTILVGALLEQPTWALIAVIGVLVSAAFTLRAVQVVFFGQTGPVSTQPPEPLHYEPVTWPERTGALLLLATTLLIGLKPELLLNWIEPSLNNGTFDRVFRQIMGGLG